MTPSSFTGKKFSLEFNGSYLNGLPGQEASYAANGDRGYWLSLVNPKDGVTVTDSDGSEYVLKAREVAETFVTAPIVDYNPAIPALYDPAVVKTNDCDDLSFDALNDLGAGGADNGWQVSDLPEAHTPTGLALHPQSANTWKDLPAAGTMKCSVAMGLADGCE